MKPKVIVIGTALSAGVIYVVSKLLATKKVGDKLDTVTSVNVHSIKASGLTLRIDVTLKNPTEGELTIKQPYVKLLYGTSDLGTSTIENKIIKITPFSQQKIAPIYFTISAMGLLTLGKGLLKALQNKEGAVINATIISGIKLAGGFRYYEKKETFHLKRKA